MTFSARSGNLLTSILKNYVKIVDVVSTYVDCQMTYTGKNGIANKGSFQKLLSGFCPDNHFAKKPLAERQLRKVR